MRPFVFFPTELQKERAGHQSVKMLNSLTSYSDDILEQAHVLQIVLECFEEQYNINIRGGVSVSKDDRFRPTPIQ